jgi:hypothetical protein
MAQAFCAVKEHVGSVLRMRKTFNQRNHARSSPSLWWVIILPDEDHVNKEQGLLGGLRPDGHR